MSGFKSKLVWLSLVAALLVGSIWGVGLAREWSEEVQMTDAGPMYLNGSFFGAVVDSNDVLHISYQVNQATIEGQPGYQAVYQQFDKYGRALTDPIFLGTYFPVEESLERGIHCYDLYMDRNQNIHILWGQDTLLHSMLSNEAEHIVSCRLEGILMQPGVEWDCLPHAIVDSQDRLVVISKTCTYWDTLAHSRNYFLSYGRWTFEGQLIDTIHFLAEGPPGELAMDAQIYITEGDTLHFSWNQNPFMEAWFYAKVGPNDERIICPMELFEPTADEYRLGSWNFLVDDEYRITFRVYRRFNRRWNLVDHLTQYLPNLEVRYDRLIDGEGYGGVWGHIRFGHNQDIHMASIRIIDPRQCDYRIAYARFSIDGEYLDSLQFPQHDKASNQMWPVVFSDSTVAVIWSDGRFADGIRSNELFMRYSLPPNQVNDKNPIPRSASSFLLSAHPNPFNGTVLLKFEAQKPGNYTFHIRSIKGEEVWSNRLLVTIPGCQSVLWDGRSREGLPLPSGSYVCLLEGTSTRDSIVLQLIK